MFIGSQGMVWLQTLDVQLVSLGSVPHIILLLSVFLSVAPISSGFSSISRSSLWCRAPLLMQPACGGGTCCNWCVICIERRCHKPTCRRVAPRLFHVEARLFPGTEHSFAAESRLCDDVCANSQYTGGDILIHSCWSCGKADERCKVASVFCIEETSLVSAGSSR